MTQSPQSDRASVRRWRPLRLATWLVVLIMPATAMAQTVTRAQVMAALPALDATAKQQVANGAVPGLAIAVVFDDQVVFSKGYGLRQAGKPDAVTPDTVFQIASMSKPVSSTIVAALVSKGLVSWDSRIADIDPSFRLHDAYPTAELTVRDLFVHRSGLPGVAGNELEDIGYDRGEILHRLALVPASSSFRAVYSYSNFGLTEGAVAAAKPTSKSWEQVADDFLYRPLAMASTSSRYADFVRRGNRASLHVKIDGKWVVLQRQPDAQAPAGGVSSSVRDLAQWLRLELADGKFNGKPLIAAKALAETHEPQIGRGTNPVTGAAAFYALGWNVEFGRHGLTWGHAGAFSVGARSLVTLYPKAKLGIVLLANTFPTGVPEGIADEFADQAFDGKPGKDWITPWNEAYSGLLGAAAKQAKARYAAPPATPTPALVDAAYVGHYANAYIGEATVSARNHVLTVRLGPGGKRIYTLRHFDRDAYICFPDPESPDVPAGVNFTIGPDGKATAITIDQLNDVGLGTLQREND
ncbi:MAG TPA: serine hydrolase [Acetobacteraceae bacterium]|nr:serine hydrolase [Acetobacteraceae bacterium]